MALFRDPAPDGSLGPDNKPLTILPENTILKRRYKVSYLTAGGMGTIYSAKIKDTRLIIKEVAGAHPKLVIALNQEKNTIERLDHDAIVKFYDFFEEEGYYYLVLEYVEGETLTELLKSKKDDYFSEKEVVKWALQICDVFSYLHNLIPPIIYRDLKPDNIIYNNKTGKLKLIDFGVARIFKKGKTSDDDYRGSVVTASPEHYGGAQTDARSDIYTLGATMHYLLTNGKGITDEEFVFHRLSSINENVSPALEEIINKAISLDPEDRYQNIDDFKKALIASQPGMEDKDIRLRPIESPQELKKKKKQIIDETLGKKTTDEDKKKLRIVIYMAAVLLIIAIIVILVTVFFSKEFLLPANLEPTPVSGIEFFNKFEMVKTIDEKSDHFFLIAKREKGGTINLDILREPFYGNIVFYKRKNQASGERIVCKCTLCQQPGPLKKGFLT